MFSMTCILRKTTHSKLGCRTQKQTHAVSPQHHTHTHSLTHTLTHTHNNITQQPASTEVVSWETSYASHCVHVDLKHTHKPSITRLLPSA
mmetsp:Transcript_8387/g.23873  ORF Transcript_8387/g.23873 Transcript_8387/m.23873 type:complete len:90 (-) Transcript_8387:974-1243(-)